MSKYNYLSKILHSYKDIKNDIKIIIDEIKYYDELLQNSDLSELEYYKPSEYIGIKYIYMVYSEVEKSVLHREKVHNLNYEIIKQLKSKSKTKLLEYQNKIINIDNSINSLSYENKYLIEKKFLENFTYIQIAEMYSKKFKYYLSEQTIKKRVKKSLKIIDTKINKILFLNFK